MNGTVVFVSDTHINSTVSLVRPVVNLDDGGTYHANRWQRALWRSWLSLWEQLTDYPRPHYLVLGGDLVEVDSKRRSVQLITRNKSTAVQMAVDTLMPAVDWADKCLVLRGTEAHTGKSGQYEEMIAADIGAVPDDERGTASWWHFIGYIGGVKFDLAHHVSMGARPWTEKNAANRLAAVTQWRYWERGEELPRYVVRGHVHRVSDSGINYQVRALTAPCWTALPAHGYRIGAENANPHIGALVFTVEGVQYVCYRLRRAKRRVVRL